MFLYVKNNFGNTTQVQSGVPPCISSKTDGFSLAVANLYVLIQSRGLYRCALRIFILSNLKKLSLCCEGKKIEAPPPASRFRLPPEAQILLQTACIYFAGALQE